MDVGGWSATDRRKLCRKKQVVQKNVAIEVACGGERMLAPEHARVSRVPICDSEPNVGSEDCIWECVSHDVRACR